MINTCCKSMKIIMMSTQSLAWSSLQDLLRWAHSSLQACVSWTPAKDTQPSHDLFNSALQCHVCILAGQIKVHCRPNSGLFCILMARHCIPVLPSDGQSAPFCAHLST